MDLIPLKIGAHCVMSDEGLYNHIRLALLRGLPLIEPHPEHDGVVVLVGSGPSVKGQIESIRKHREAGHAIVAIKDAHDWLVDQGIIPDYAVAVDPQEHRWNCFILKRPEVRYMIASQCHPAMFDHLEGHKVFLWHLYIKEGQTYPPDSWLVTGGTTTGLRAISLFYSMGWRKFELYGYDSCLSDGDLRVNGTKANSTISVIVGGKTFTSSPEMAAQANEFQTLYTVMPDMEVTSHGRGIITTILEERSRPKEASFIHGNETMASYRYRCKIPANQLGWPINNYSAKVVIFSKPAKVDVEIARSLQDSGRKVVVDFCDDHFSEPYYHALAKLADAITCPTEKMRQRLEAYGYTATVIPDPYECAEVMPHCNGENLLWFGHGSNYESLRRVLPEVAGYPLRVVSNVEGSIPWSLEVMAREFLTADIVIIPATADYKSPNRAVEAIRQGCFVVAEPHPSINDFPGIWIGNIREGIQWAIVNRNVVNGTRAQEYVKEHYSPARVASVWKTLVRELTSTSDAVESTGTDG